MNVFGTTLGKSINLKVNGAERFFLQFGEVWFGLVVVVVVAGVMR